MEAVDQQHSFGGRALDRYVLDFDPDDPVTGDVGDVGGGAETEAEAVAQLTQPLAQAAETAPAEWDDPELSVPADEATGVSSVGVTDEELRETIEFARGLKSELAEMEAAQQRADLAAAIRDANDPFSESYDPDAAEQLAALLTGGDVAAAAGGNEDASLPAALELQGWAAAVAPDLAPERLLERAESILDDVHEQTGLRGEELVAVALEQAAGFLRGGRPAEAPSELGFAQLVAQEEAAAAARVDGAEQRLEALFGRVDPKLDRGAVRARAGELIADVHTAREDGRDAPAWAGTLTGSALVERAIREASEDLAAETEEDVVRRLVARQREGLPAVKAPPRHVRPTSAQASKARVEARRLERVAEQALADANLAALRPEDAQDELEAVRRVTARRRATAL